MIKSLFLVSIFFTTLSYSQISDTLRKYSYFIVGFKPVNKKELMPGSGTGYFIRNDGKLYFLTARHVICPCDQKDTCKPFIKRSVYPDTMTIYLTHNGSINYRYIKINTKPYYDTCNCWWPPIHPDIIAYEISTPTDTVYSLEGLITDELKGKTESVSIYGYPAHKYKIMGGFYEQNSSNLPLTDFKIVKNYRYKNCAGTYSIDRQDYIIITRQIELDKLFGYSGSPVFALSKRDKRWQFLGTFTATVEDGKMQVIKPPYSFDAITRAVR